MTKKESKEKRTKGILVRVLPSVYDECQEYNLNLPLIMRRAIANELAIHKAKLCGMTCISNLMWKDYDDKTMSFRNSE